MAGLNYSKTVLIGNWNEERLQNEFDFKTFLRKRDRKELLLQRSRILFKNLLMERPLEISGMFVMFGYNAQIVATDMPAKGRLKNGKPEYGLAMSVLVTSRQVDYMQNINEGCSMTLSPITTPCCRNTFFIVSTKDESIRGEKLRYGEEFLLKCVNYGDPTAPYLYVRYYPEAIPGPADTLPLRLSTTKDSNCRWVAEPLLRSQRIELLGTPVKTGVKLVIKNCVADKNLCVMNQTWMQTFLGLECGVTCRNCMDYRKCFTADNVFVFLSDVKTKGRE